MKNSIVGLVAIVIGIFVLFWVLKIAIKLALLAVVAVVAVAAFYAVKNRIGGPRA